MRIGSGSDAEAVKEQYKNAGGLNTRLSFHDRYSTNRQGYGNWILSHYEIRDGMQVLELGCGTGSIWIGQEDLIKKCGKLLLTDLSEGMLDAARENLGEREPIAYRQADIQHIPFEDDSFDVVIANSMLYHVPDLLQGLREVRRVLREGGFFYCSTLGEHNFVECLAEWFRLDGERFTPNHNFTMQNGEEILKTVFSVVKAAVYEDSLHVTEPEELVKYLRSLASFRMVMDIPVDKIREILKEHVRDGAVDLPKEYGMFICR